MVIELSSIFLLILKALPAILAIAGCTWLVSLYLNKISIIYYSWPVVLMLPALVYLIETRMLGSVQIALVVMVCCWALRLSLFAIVRGRHQPEDRRYKELRERSASSFRLQSFYLIFVAANFGSCSQLPVCYCDHCRYDLEFLPVCWRCPVVIRVLL